MRNSLVVVVVVAIVAVVYVVIVVIVKMHLDQPTFLTDVVNIIVRPHFNTFRVEKRQKEPGLKLNRAKLARPESKSSVQLFRA